MGLDSRVHSLHGQHGADLLPLPDRPGCLDRVHVEQLEAKSWRSGGNTRSVRNHNSDFIQLID